MSVFVHDQGIKTVHAGGGVKKWQNSVHVVVECPLSSHFLEFNSIPIVLVPADTNILKPFSNAGSIQILPHEL